MPHRLAGLALLMGLGCVPQRPAPSSTPSAIPEVVPRNPLDEPWTIERKDMKVSHIFRVDALVVSRIDGRNTVDSVSSQATVTWESTRDGQWVGAVTDYLVGTDSVRRPPGITFPTPIVITRPRQPTQVPRFVVPAEGSCVPVAAISQVVREGIVTTPSVLRRGQTWSDSAETTVCRDSIPLRVTTVRRYRVAGAELRAGRLVVLIDRASTVRMRGEGRQLGEPVQLSAEGTGTMQLALTADDGIVAAGEGTNELVLTFTGRRRSQELRQRSTVRIVRR